MINPIAMHDQALAFIQQESLTTELSEGLSFEILAKQFEGYWRQVIARELDYLETPTGISPDWYAACKRSKLAAIAIAIGGIPDGLI